jgi:hypothetical protein
MDEQLKHFAQNGYVVIEGALPPEEVARVNDGIAADESANPEEWEPGPRPGFVSVGCGAPGLMHRTDALDHMVHPPTVMPLIKEILGEEAQFCNLSFMRREPCDADPPEAIDDGDPIALSRNWHREYSGIVDGADQNDYYTPGIQVIYYLNDVDEGAHCTSIIPESAETKRQFPKVRDADNSWGKDVLRIDDGGAYVDPEKPTWLDAFGRNFARLIGRMDVHAPAGSALVFNQASYHCGTVRKTERSRGTTHVFYRVPEPRNSRHSLANHFPSITAFHDSLPKRLRLAN